METEDIQVVKKKYVFFMHKMYFLCTKCIFFIFHAKNASIILSSETFGK